MPIPTVTWTKDDELIISGGRYTIQDDGSLLINEADIEETVRYTCTAESVAGKDSASSTIQTVSKYSLRLLEILCSTMHVTLFKLLSII